MAGAFLQENRLDPALEEFVIEDGRRAGRRARAACDRQEHPDQDASANRRNKLATVRN
jgi:hypothetical protein